MESHTFGKQTDTGRVRKSNQDSLAAFTRAELNGLADGLYVVADGMGGRAGGEIASRVTVETVPKVVREILSAPEGYDPQERMVVALSEALKAANDAVFGQAKANPELRGMGTTCVAVMIQGDLAVVGNIGDSRVYLLRDGVIRALTHDHSLVAQHVLAGELTEEEARASRYRNVITRAIGIAQGVEPDVEVLRLRPGDTILLCSDGLTNMLTDTEIARILARGDDPAATCSLLVNSANAAGGLDNISTVVIRYGEFSPVEIADDVGDETNYAAPPAYPEPPRPGPWRYLQIPLLLAIAAGAWFALSRYELYPSAPYLRPRKVETAPKPTPPPAPAPKTDYSNLDYGAPRLLLDRRIKGSALAVTADGTAIVVDVAEGRVWQVSADKKLSLSIFRQPGRDLGGAGLAVDPGGNRYVVSPEDRVIRKLNVNGTRIAQIGQGELSRPTQIGIHPAGHIYVIDDGRLKIILATPKRKTGADNRGPR